MTPLLDHLWQSTLFAAGAFGLTLLLRGNSASTRYWLWLAASVKFLIPFSLLVSAGSRVEWRDAPVATHAVTVATAQLAQPFTKYAPAPEERTSVPYLPFLWGCGSLSVLGFWLRRAHRLRALVLAATPRPELPAPIPMLSTPTLLEPGVVGIFRPVLLMPEGLHEKLSPAQMHAIVSHEMCHVRRWDNLTALIHMAVEAIFWFHPLVWWIGARLVEERERACDEEVLRLGSSPEAYAESIVSICRFYVQSPLPCASGVTGADMKQRVTEIMTHRVAQSLTMPRRLAIALAGALAIAAPLLVGVLKVSAQTDGGARFEVASIRPNHSGGFNWGFHRSGALLRTDNTSARSLIETAYNIQYFQLDGGPRWMDSDRFDIVAKQGGFNPEAGPSDRWRECLQNLLKDRFQLELQREVEPKPGYVLTLAKGGHKLVPATSGKQGASTGSQEMTGSDVSLDEIAAMFSEHLARTVKDETGLTGHYDFRLTFSLDTEGSIFTAVQEQLGLKLESKKVPTEIFRIVRLEKPSEN